MQLDRNTVNTILALDDKQLLYVINRMAGSIGIDITAFGISGNDVSTIRKRLTELTDSELAEAQRQIEEKKNGFGR